MNLHQHMTPAWAAAAIVRRHFPSLSARDTVWEPSCGDGRFLLAIPAHVDAFGTEIDPRLADEARRNTGREVLTADFRTVDLPRRPTAVIGNPPFALKLVQPLLQRCYEELEYGGRVGLILPAYLLQLARGWCVRQEMLPRDLFPGIKHALLFVNFEKQRKAMLCNFFLYREAASLRGLKDGFREIRVGNNSKTNVWRETVRKALTELGGKATLQQVYEYIESNKPTATKFWREKVRQVLREHQRVERATYQLAEAA